MENNEDIKIADTEEIEIPNIEAGDPEEKKPKKEKVNAIKEIYDWLINLSLALLIMISLLLFVFKYVTVDGTSMTDTLQNEQIIIISPLCNYENGDIVVLYKEGYNKPLVKRIIASEGQTISFDFESWSVYVDGVKIDEPYIKFVSYGSMKSYNIGTLGNPYTVPEGCVFVMGDNRNGSTDSRVFGAVKKRDIIGEAVFSIKPFGSIE